MACMRLPSARLSGAKCLHIKHACLFAAERRSMAAHASSSDNGKGDDGFDFDLFVIGGGTGGVRAARMSATYGVRLPVHQSVQAFMPG